MVPYVFFLIAIGLPFNHNLVWLYVLPPGVLTWLTTRPVIESKRLPELVTSQLRYVSEPRTWCRMAPLTEKDDVLVTVRVWHGAASRARQKKAKQAPALATRGAAAIEAAAMAEEQTAHDVAPRTPSSQKLAKARKPANARKPAKG